MRPIKKNILSGRTPTIVRITNETFNDALEALNVPYESLLSDCMEAASEYLFTYLDNCILSYERHNEIILLLWQFEPPYVNYNADKLVSCAASVATAEFNAALIQLSNQCMPLWKACSKNNTGNFSAAMDKFKLFQSRDCMATFTATAFPIDAFDINQYIHDVDKHIESVEIELIQSYSKMFMIRPRFVGHTIYSAEPVTDFSKLYEVIDRLNNISKEGAIL